MKLSIVIPAYNEEAYLPKTLDALKKALATVQSAEIIVVDNESSDTTREIAVNYGATIVDEQEHNIGKVRNTGADSSTGDVIIFVDADTLVSPGIFEKIETAMSDQRCCGGSVAVKYETAFRRLPVRFFMHLWVFLGKYTKMRQGAFQFARRDIFLDLNGYDTTIFVGEDVEFHWRLNKLARKSDGFTAFIEEPFARTSSRRWDNMGLIRMLIFTHPVTMFLGWRVRSLWKDWYENAIR